MYIDDSAPEIPNRKIIVKNSAIRSKIDSNSEIKGNLQIASPSNKDTNILLINSQKHSQQKSKTSTQNPSINHKDNYFLSTFLSKETEEGKESVKEKNSINMCCLTKLVMKLFPSVIIKKELENDLHFISYLLSLSYNSNDSIHNKILNSIKLFFIDTANLSILHNNETPKIFSLLQMLSMYQLYPSYMLKIFTIVKKHMVSLFEKVTSMCSEIFESEKMLILYNNNNNVIDTLNDFVLGVIDIVIEGISSVVNIKDIEDTLRKTIEEVENRIKESPSSIVWKAKLVKEKYKNDVNSMTMSLVDDITN